MNRWDVLTKKIDNHAMIGAEIGVYTGEMSENLLKLNPYLRLIMVDQWKTDNTYIDPIGNLSQDEFDQLYFDVQQKMVPFYDRSIILRISSKVATLTIKNQLDFVFIDANHSYESVKEDIQLWRPLIKKGGFISGHDYGVYEGVERAVREVFEIGSIILLDDYVWMVEL